jgi:AraC family transcriptional regulator, transcriptional activator of pobA
MTAPRLNLAIAGGSPLHDMRIVPIQRLAAGGRWRTEAMRSYSCPLLLWFTKGQGRITVAGVTRGYGPHNAVFVPAGTMHGFDMLGQVFGQALFLPRDGAGMFWPDKPLHLRLREVGVQSDLTGLLDTLERELQSDDPASARAAQYQTGLISVFLERHAGDADPYAAPRRARAADRLAAAFTTLVERDFARPRQISDYATELGVTPTHLTRVCRATCGRGALEILSDRKLYEARRRLTETREPVKDIAASLGFASAAYFTRAFRAETGMSPTEFRKRG